MARALHSETSGCQSGFGALSAKVVGHLRTSANSCPAICDASVGVLMGINNVGRIPMTADDLQACTFSYPAKDVHDL